jgi:hypothetical protein
MSGCACLDVNIGVCVYECVITLVYGDGGMWTMREGGEKKARRGDEGESCFKLHRNVEAFHAV